MFDNGKMAPLVLGITVGLGILLPLGLAVCYLTKSGGFPRPRTDQYHAALVGS